MLTSRGSGLLGGGVALWIASQTFGAPELQVAAVAALVLLGLALLSVWTTSTQLRIDRLVEPTKLPFGTEGRVRLAVTNAGLRRTARLRLDEQAPPVLASPPQQTLPPLHGGERVELEYRIRGEQRGVATLGPMVVGFSDPFGLVSRSQTLPGTATVTVRPRIVPLQRGLPLGGFSGGTGEGRPRPRPGGEDVAEVRDYVRGDPLRAIHWPSTAHRGKLMVRHEESPQDPRATVVLDLRATRHRGSGPTSSLETAVSAAASVITHLAARGQAVALVDGVVPAPAPARSAEEWLDHLAEVEATGGSLRRNLAPLTTSGAVGSALIAVVATPDGPDLQALVRSGRSATTRVALVIDPASHTGDRRRDPTSEGVAARLRSAGWRVTIVAGGDDLAVRWNEILHVRRAAVGV